MVSISAFQAFGASSILATCSTDNLSAFFYLPFCNPRGVRIREDYYDTLLKWLKRARCNRVIFIGSNPIGISNKEPQNCGSFLFRLLGVQMLVYLKLKSDLEIFN